MRTYSRQDRSSCLDRPPAKKRRRIDPGPATTLHATTSPTSSPRAPSSPSRETSSAAEASSRQCTPPSSPPPSSSPPAYPRRKPMFAFLKRKPGAGQITAPAPLKEGSGNVAQPPSSREPSKKKRTRLTQTQLDLGGDLRKTCAECGMSFIPSSVEDVALHKRHHDRHATRARLQLSKATVDLLRAQYKVAEGEKGGFMAVVGRSASVNLRRTVEGLVDLVNMEMAAVEIDRETLWSTVRAQRIGSDGTRQHRKGDTPVARTNYDRYKVLVYIKEQKCVGLCLAERIAEAFVCVGAEEEEEDGDTATRGSRAALRLGNSADEALLGISRIWTSSEERRTGLATTLLNCATENFLYGMKIPKARVAFSQPTESGHRLARRWFGQQAGWHVYTTTQ